jgi:GxxExxY protein
VQRDDTVSRMNPQVAQTAADSKDKQTNAIIGAQWKFIDTLVGIPGTVYQQALAIEFSVRGVPFAREVDLPVRYKGERLSCSYRADFVRYNGVIVELKALKAITSIEDARVLNYLKAPRLERRLLVNFGRPSLEFRRFVFSNLRKSAKSADER